MRYIQAMCMYILTDAATQIKPEDIMLTKISQLKKNKDKHYMILFTRGARVVKTIKIE